MKDASVKKIIQKMQPDEINTFLWDDNSVLHRHSDWEFTSTIDGTGTNIVNGTDYPLMPGDFVLLGPQHVHRFVSDSADIRRRDVCIADEKFQKLCSVLSPSLRRALPSRKAYRRSPQHRNFRRTPQAPVQAERVQFGRRSRRRGARLGRDLSARHLSRTPL